MPSGAVKRQHAPPVSVRASLCGTTYAFTPGRQPAQSWYAAQLPLVAEALHPSARLQFAYTLYHCAFATPGAHAIPPAHSSAAVIQIPSKRFIEPPAHELRADKWSS